jgi:chromosome segregation ATPase
VDCKCIKENVILQIQKEINENKTEIAVLKSNVNAVKEDIETIFHKLDDLNKKVDDGFSNINEKINKGFASIHNRNTGLMISVILLLIVGILNLLGVGVQQ